MSKMNMIVQPTLRIKVYENTIVRAPSVVTSWPYHCGQAMWGMTLRTGRGGQGRGEGNLIVVGLGGSRVGTIVWDRQITRERGQYTWHEESQQVDRLQISKLKFSAAIWFLTLAFQKCWQIFDKEVGRYQNLLFWKYLMLHCFCTQSADHRALLSEYIWTAKNPSRRLQACSFQDNSKLIKLSNTFSIWIH